MTAPRRSRLALAAACVTAAALLLTGCADQQAGSAATLGDNRITEQTLTSHVQAVLAAKGQPATSTGPEPGAADPRPPDHRSSSSTPRRP